MEEKERYELLDDYDIDVIVDNITHSEFTNSSQFCDILNQQDKRIKELELLLNADEKMKTNSVKGFEKLRQENLQLKEQIEQMVKDYTSEIAFYTGASDKQIAVKELDKYKETVQELQGTSSKMFDKLLENHLHKFQEHKDFDFSKTLYGKAIERNKELKEENKKLKNDIKLFIADELCEILYRFENKDIFLKDYLNKRIKDLREKD